MNSEPGGVRVWDLPTRAFHWVLAMTVVCSVASAKIGGNAMVWHFRFGYVVFTLLAFRILWGLVGGRWSRFASFVFAPATLLRYLRGQSRADEHLDVGHSPTGALSVFALLAVLSVQVGTGLFSDDEIASAGPLTPLAPGRIVSAATHWHSAFGQVLVLLLVLLHVAAIVFYRVRGRNLVTPMLTGDKVLPAGVPASADGGAQRLLALALVLACAALVTWVVSLGGG